MSSREYLRLYNKYCYECQKERGCKCIRSITHCNKIKKGEGLIETDKGELLLDRIIEKISKC